MVWCNDPRPRLHVVEILPLSLLLNRCVILVNVPYLSVLNFPHFFSPISLIFKRGWESQYVLRKY